MGKGWSFLNRKIDDYDVEWETWKSIISKYWYLLVIHSVTAEIFRYLRFKVSSLVEHVLITLTILIFRPFRYFTSSLDLRHASSFTTFSFVW